MEKSHRAQLRAKAKACRLGIEGPWVADAGSSHRRNKKNKKKFTNETTEFVIESDRYSSGASSSLRDIFLKYYSSDNEEVDLSSLSIEELKAKMAPLTEDGLVLKLDISPGSGPVIPRKSIVLIHYEAFIEGENQPFDSTYKRNSPFKFTLETERNIHGLNVGVSTMKKGEIAKLWVHYSYAYRPVGCPSRIPDSANILYNIEIMNYFNHEDAIELEEMLLDDHQSTPFEKALPICKVEHNIGNELFNNEKFLASAARYSRAVKLLETVNVPYEEENRKRLSSLLKLYLNLALCYVKLKKGGPAICFAKKAIHLDEGNVKTLYLLGQAYELNGNYKIATRYFLQAQRLEPYDENISNALKQLEVHYQKYNDWNKCPRERKFQVKSENAREENLSQESPEFVKTIEDQIKMFKDSDESQYTFLPSFTQPQVEVIQGLAAFHELDCFEKIYNNQKKIRIKRIAKRIKQER